MEYKKIEDMLDWIDMSSKSKWLLLDTETTGLGGSTKEQLTQIAGKSYKYDLNKNSFKEISYFNKKIKLNSDSISRINSGIDNIECVLDFNGYKKGNFDYIDEKDAIKEFKEFVEENSPCALVAQNAPFDMDMLNGRSEISFKNEVIDTKMLVRLYYIPIIQKLSEKDDKYKEIINAIGTSSRDNGLISSSLSKIGPVLGIDMSGYHDALVDCDLMRDMITGIIDIMKKNRELDIEKYQLERINS